MKTILLHPKAKRERERYGSYSTQASHFWYDVTDILPENFLFCSGKKNQENIYLRHQTVNGILQHWRRKRVIRARRVKSSESRAKDWRFEYPVLKAHKSLRPHFKKFPCLLSWYLRRIKPAAKFDHLSKKKKFFSKKFVRVKHREKKDITLTILI